MSTSARTLNLGHSKSRRDVLCVGYSRACAAVASGARGLALAMSFALSVSYGHANTLDVGVIPKSPNQCPAGSEYVTIYMDDEDNNNSSYSSGWTGAISQPFSSHVDGTRLAFCRVDGSLFFNLGHANLINWENLTYDSQKASVGAYDYSVLKLGSSCPNGSKEYVSTIDNEDNNNKNSSTGNISPNNVHVTNRGKTALYFCLFTPSSGPSMTDFPDIGITYGVFAGKVAPPTGPGHRNYWLATGVVYTDDEDRRNANSTVHSGFSTDDIFAAAAGVSIGLSNTTFHIAKVRDKTGLCSRPVNWWDTSQVQPSFDGANCFVRSVPSGAQPFVWANNYYIKPTSSQVCPLGPLAGIGCFIMTRPPGGFISNNAFYVPAANNVCPSTPPGSVWTLTGSYCVLGAPWGTQAFMTPIFIGGSKFYTTTRFNCQDGSFDGANCYMGAPPSGTTAFIWSNNFYYSE
jgi:hypothetical protein